MDSGLGSGNGLNGLISVGDDENIHHSDKQTMFDQASYGVKITAQGGEPFTSRGGGRVLQDGSGAMEVSNIVAVISNIHRSVFVLPQYSHAPASLEQRHFINLPH